MLTYVWIKWNAILTALGWAIIFALGLVAYCTGPVHAQEHQWTVNPMPICNPANPSQCLPTPQFTDNWGPYEDEATCLARIEEMQETLEPLLQQRYPFDLFLKSRGCSGPPGEEI